MIRRALGALLLLLSLIAPAWAAIGTPTYIGSASDATSTVSSITITTTANSASGDLRVIAIIGASGLAVSTSVSENGSAAGYSFSPICTWNGTSNKLFLAYKPNAPALASGSTITVSWSGTARVAVAAVTIPNAATSSPLDTEGTCATGTGTSAATAGATLAQSDETIIVVTGAGNTTAGYNPGGSYGILTAPTQGSNSTLLWAQQVVASTTGPAYNPAWTTSRSFGSNWFAFKGIGASPAAKCPPISLMGVGC